MAERISATLPYLIINNIMHKASFRIFLIAIIGIIVYSNTFDVPFHWDDKLRIVNDYRLRDLSNFWPPSGARWFGFLTFALNYKMGDLNVTGYHIFNLTIHIINAFLVYWLVVLTFRTPYFSNQLSAVSYQQKETPIHSFADSPIHPFTYSPSVIALFSALIFVAHPVQTQAVTYIVQRFTSLATMFYLLSLVMYIEWRFVNWQLAISHQPSADGTRKLRIFLLNTKCYMLYAVSVLSALLAMKTKEISFTLPFTIAIYEFCFFKGRSKRRILYLIPIIFTMLIVPLGIDKPLSDLISDAGEATKELTTMSRWDYLFTQFRVIVTYIRLLFLPVNQNLDYDYPLSHSFFEPRTIVSLLLLICIFGFAIYLFKQSKSTNNNYGILSSFGILWFFLTLSIESSIIPIRDVIFEHRLYLPSVGAVMAFSSMVFWGLDHVKLKISPLFTICLLFLFTTVPLGIATYNRNLIWKDDVTLWADVVRKSPYKERGHNNLGDAYNNNGRTDSAIEHFQIALKLKPDYAEAHTNLGLAYYKQGRLNEAIEEYKIALKLKPDYAEAHTNLGVAYYSQGRAGEAAKEYMISLMLKPNSAGVHYNLGVVYHNQRRLNEAVQEYKAALMLEPNYVGVHYNLGVAYKQKGLINEARKEFQTALKIQPDFSPASRNLESLWK